MDNVKHTKGPWLIREMGLALDDGYTIERCADGLRSVVAEVREQWLCPEHGGTGAQANARLIAAAPELLATLGDVELRCTQARIASTIGKKDQTEFLRGELERIAEHARAILAKVNV